MPSEQRYTDCRQMSRQVDLSLLPGCKQVNQSVRVVRAADLVLLKTELL
jgi:hypothetical protein